MKPSEEETSNWLKGYMMFSYLPMQPPFLKGLLKVSFGYGFSMAQIIWFTQSIYFSWWVMSKVTEEA